MTISIPPEYGKEAGGFPVVLSLVEPELLEAVSHTLNLTQEGRTVWIYQRVAHTLSLTDNAVYAKVKAQNVSQALALVQSARPTYTVNEADALSLDSIVNEFNVVADRAPAGNVLNLSQTVFSIASSAPIEQVLALTHEAVGVGPFNYYNI